MVPAGEGSRSTRRVALGPRTARIASRSAARRRRPRQRPCQRLLPHGAAGQLSGQSVRTERLPRWASPPPSLLNPAVLY
eukprot:scaffold100973_cov17-Prasinocladus_malaysianus.AAC.1